MADDSREPGGRRLPPRAVTIGVALIAATTLLVHVRSYWRSDSLTLCDATVTTDEGLASLQIPLTRLAANVDAESNFTIYERNAKMWSAGVAGKTTLRHWMQFIRGSKTPSSMIGDFGYWKGDWQSNSRPGPFVVAFVPVWFVGLAALAVFFALRRWPLRFRVSTLLAMMTVVALLTWLLALRAPIEKSDGVQRGGATNPRAVLAKFATRGYTGGPPANPGGLAE